MRWTRYVIYAGSVVVCLYYYHFYLSGWISDLFGSQAFLFIRDSIRYILFLFTGSDHNYGSDIVSPRHWRFMNSRLNPAFTLAGPAVAGGSLALVWWSDCKPVDSEDRHLRLRERLARIGLALMWACVLLVLARCAVRYSEISGPQGEFARYSPQGLRHLRVESQHIFLRHVAPMAWMFAFAISCFGLYAWRIWFGTPCLRRFVVRNVIAISTISSMLLAVVFVGYVSNTVDRWLSLYRSDDCKYITIVLLMWSSLAGVLLTKCLPGEQHLCKACGYDLRGCHATTAECPECGVVFRE